MFLIADITDPDKLDQYVGIIANRGATIVITTIVVLFIAALLWFFYRDILPELKAWFVAAKNSTVKNTETLDKLHDTMRDFAEFNKSVVEDRRQCRVITEIHLMRTEIDQMFADGHKREPEIKQAVDKIRHKAIDALTNPTPRPTPPPGFT